MAEPDTPTRTPLQQAEEACEIARAAFAAGDNLNIYRRQFVSVCPADGDTIIYTLEIRSRAMVRVEHINIALALESKAFHEEIADRLFARFGGEQRITAVHQGVEIETRRGFA